MGTIFHLSNFDRVWMHNNSKIILLYKHTPMHPVCDFGNISGLFSPRKTKLNKLSERNTLGTPKNPPEHPQNTPNLNPSCPLIPNVQWWWGSMSPKREALCNFLNRVFLNISDWKFSVLFKLKLYGSIKALVRFSGNVFFFFGGTLLLILWGDSWSKKWLINLVHSTAQKISKKDAVNTESG